MTNTLNTARTYLDAGKLLEAQTYLTALAMEDDDTVRVHVTTSTNGSYWSCEVEVRNAQRRLFTYTANAPILKNALHSALTELRDFIVNSDI